MSGIFTCIGSIISGIRERIRGVDVIDFKTHPIPKYSINEDGEIEDAPEAVEAPIIEQPRGSKPRSLFPSRRGLDLLSRFKKPIDIIKQAIPQKKVNTTPAEIAESPAESRSRAQRREEARVQKKAEKKKPLDVQEKEIIFREIELSGWMKERKIIAIHRGIVPKANEDKYDDLYLLESI